MAWSPRHSSLKSGRNPSHIRASSARAALGHMGLITAKMRATGEGWTAPLAAHADGARTLVLALRGSGVRQRSDAPFRQHRGLSDLADRRLLDRQRNRQYDRARRQRWRGHRPLRAHRPAPSLRRRRQPDRFVRCRNATRRATGWRRIARRVRALRRPLCQRHKVGRRPGPRPAARRRHHRWSRRRRQPIPAHGSSIARSPSRTGSAPSASMAIGCSLATAAKAAGPTSAPSGASPARRATCCSSSTASPRSSCIGPISGNEPKGCPERRCSFRSRSGAKATPAKRWCTILGIDDATVPTFAGDMPEGGVARLMRANTDKLINARQRRPRRRGWRFGSADALVVSVSCVGRRLVLGGAPKRKSRRCRRARRRAPPTSASIPGEISPTSRGGASDLQPDDDVVTCLRRRPTMNYALLKRRTLRRRSRRRRAGATAWHRRCNASRTKNTTRALPSGALAGSRLGRWQLHATMRADRDLDRAS